MSGLSSAGAAPAHGAHGRRYRPTGRAHAVAPFFVSATLCLLTAGALALAQATPAPLPGLLAWRWPVIHLAFVGGVTQLIAGAMAFFAVTLLRTEAPPAWLTRAQWLLVNLGALGLVGGLLIGQPAIGAAGGAAVLAAVGLLLATLRLLRRRALVAPDPTFGYYLAAIVCVVAGATLGILMLLGLSDAVLPRGQVRLAHLHLNLNGWVTLTIIGTMRLFFGTTLGAPARYLNPRWAEFWPLVAGVALSSLGWLIGAPALIGAGSLLQLAGTAAYCRSVIRQWRAHAGPRPLAAGHLLAGTLWLALLTLGGLAGAGLRPLDPELAAAATRAVTIAGFAGFIGQTVLGAWTHLFSVVAALPAGPLPALATPLRPRLRATLQAWPRLQLALANAGVAGLVLAALLVPAAPAAWLQAAGLVALAALLALVAAKAGRAGALVWQARRAGAPAATIPAGPARG
jgi:hypothetical protein